MDTPARKLEEIVEEFAELEPRERLELLLEFSENLPPLPPKYQAEKDAGQHRVHECQTPVFLWVELDADGRLAVHGDVAPEAPTVKGFVGILVEAFTGATPTEVLEVKQDLLQRMGLVQSLGMVRMRGLHSILYYIRQETQKIVAAA